MNWESHRLKESPSQTAGPYLHIGLTPENCGAAPKGMVNLGTSLVGTEYKGERITIEGIVYDGAHEPLCDALIELWQADEAGRYLSQNIGAELGKQQFTGWGRQTTHPDSGLFRFSTIKPGPVAFTGGRLQAPHVTFWIVARGINTGLHTRMYFPGDRLNKFCPVLGLIDASRRDTLIAKRNDDVYHFDIYLQGERETVFFDS